MSQRTPMKIAGVATLAAGGGTTATLTIGPLVFALILAGFAALARRTMAAGENALVVRFPREPVSVSFRDSVRGHPGTVAQASDHRPIWPS